MAKKQSYLEYKLQGFKQKWEIVSHWLPWLIFAWYPAMKLSDSDAYDAERFFIVWICLLELWLYGAVGMTVFSPDIGLLIALGLVLLTAVVYCVVDYKAWRFINGSDRYG